MNHSVIMKITKIFFTFLLFGVAFHFSFAQNFTLTIQSALSCDTVSLKKFDKQKDFKNLVCVPYKKVTVLQQNEMLEPGLYKVMRDTSEWFSFLISDLKKQKLKVTISSTGDVYFENSNENNHWISYHQKMGEYDQQIRKINKTFADAQKSMPEYMLQTLATQLMEQMDTVIAHQEQYKVQVLNENKGTLLASIVMFSKEIPAPPASYYSNRELIKKYYAEHAFDHYPFDDERMVKIPMTVERLKEFSQCLYFAPQEDAIKIAEEVLNKARVSSVTYHAFFDQMEKVLGTLTSPYWTEYIYIPMLRNALSYDKIEQKRVGYYKNQLTLHTKNLPGTKIPNFPILWSDSTKSTLYDIESDYILLYFQNPDCPTCSEVREKLAVNEELNKAIESGKLKVVTIYFERDSTIWYRYLKTKANPKYLHGWDYEGKIDSENLFDLRIIPYMFLLDKDKMIIKKDILYNEISGYLKYYKIY